MKPSEPMHATKASMASRLEAARHTGAFPPTISDSQLQTWLEEWQTFSQGLVTFKTEVTYELLRNGFSIKNALKPTAMDRNKFTRVASSDTHWQARDNRGMVLAYKYRLPASVRDQYMATLTATTAALPCPTPDPSDNPRENYFYTHHYAVWRKYVDDPKYSGEYLKEQPHSGNFIAANMPLIQMVSSHFRMIAPRMWAHYQSLKRWIQPLGLEFLADAFPSIAINRGQDDIVDTETHQDWSDVKPGFNCVLPYGTYTGGALILWQLKVVLELQPGDVVFFLGSITAHNTEGITAGERNSIDLFAHTQLVKWCARQAAAVHGRAYDEDAEENQWDAKRKKLGYHRN